MKKKKPPEKAQDPEAMLPAVQDQQGLTPAETELRSLENIEHIKAFAKPLQEYILANKLTTKISDREWVNVEGWQFCGAAFGIVSKTIACVAINTGKEDEYCYEATVELLNLRTGAQVGRVSAICSNTENSKRYYQKYAIHSMAITRATSKAFRMLLGFIVKHAGFEVTPADEMDEVSYETELKAATQQISTLNNKVNMLTKQLGDFGQACAQVMNCQSAGDLYAIYNAYPLLKDHQPFIQIFKLRKQQLTAPAPTYTAYQEVEDDNPLNFNDEPITAKQKAELLVLSNKLKLPKEEKEVLIASVNKLTSSDASQRIHFFNERLAIQEGKSTKK